jgi:hypothetical protein
MSRKNDSGSVINHSRYTVHNIVYRKVERNRDTIPFLLHEKQDIGTEKKNLREFSCGDSEISSKRTVCHTADNRTSLSSTPAP